MESAVVDPAGGEVGVEVRAHVFLSPPQLSAIVADYFTRQGLTVERILYAVGPTEKGVIILGGQVVGCLGASLSLAPGCMVTPRAVPLPASTVRTFWEDDDVAPAKPAAGTQEARI